MCVCVKSTPKTKPMPPDHASSVTHATVVGFTSPASVIPRSSHSDKSAKATTELSSAGFSSSALGNPQFLKNPHAGISGQLNGGGTGLSMELGGILLSPNGHVGFTDRSKHSPHQPVQSVKHCLDFEDSDGCVQSPKIPRKCATVHDEQNTCKLNSDNCVKNEDKSMATVEADTNKGRRHKNVVIHSSMPISVSESQRHPACISTVTPVNQRSQKFLVCHFFYNFDP